jgi:hydrogenase maturation protease
MPEKAQTGRPTKVGRSIIIIGVGNPHRGDDGVGLIVARSLLERDRRGAEVVEESGEPAALLAAWEGADAVILIDAVSSGSAPGTIHAFDVSEAPLNRDFFRHSTHAFGVAEAVELSRALGGLPPVIWIFGIEGKSFEMSSDLSAEVMAAVPRTIRAVRDKIAEIATRFSK